MSAHTSFSPRKIVVLGLFIGLIVANVGVSMKSIQVSNELAGLQFQKSQLTKEKSLLTQQISSTFDVRSLESDAAEFGFIAVSNPLTLRVPADSAVALR